MYLYQRVVGRLGDGLRVHDTPIGVELGGTASLALVGGGCEYADSVTELNGSQTRGRPPRDYSNRDAEAEGTDTQCTDNWYVA